MTTKVITTFGKTGKDVYGDKFIKTFLKYWPKEINITIYYEDWTPNILDPRIEYLDIDQAIPEVNKFRDHCHLLLESLPSEEKTQKKINWFDKAIRWSFKSFVMYKELEKKESQYVIWLDGDVSTLKSLDPMIAKKVLNGSSFASQLEYIKGHKHCESGFVAFDTSHPDCEKIVAHLKKGYNEYAVLSLLKPWDGFWLAKMLDQNISFYDMNKDKIGSGKTFTNRYIYGVLAHDVGKSKLKNNNLHKTTGRKNNESW